MHSLRNKLKDIFVIICVTIFLLFVSNILLVIFSPVVFNQKYFSRTVMGFLDPCYQTFYHDTHDGKFDNWVAVLGDSNAAGAGDEFIEGKEEYGIFHKLRKRTNNNYLVFARYGYGNLRAVKEMKLCVGLINQTPFLPIIDDPKEIIFLFYEGNDLDNNWAHLSFKKTESLKKFMESEFHDLWKRRIRFYLPLFDILRHSPSLFISSLKRFSHYAIGEKNYNRISNVLKSQDASIMRRKKWKKNHVKFLKTKNFFPIRPQSAAMELKDDIHKALDVTLSAISDLKNNFDSAKITIIYLPSVVTSYNWEEPISIHIYQSKGELLITNSENKKRSLFIRNSIREFAKLKNLIFLDMTDVIKRAGEGNFIHGPLDYNHLNYKGYKLILDNL